MGVSMPAESKWATWEAKSPPRGLSAKGRDALWHQTRTQSCPSSCGRQLSKDQTGWQISADTSGNGGWQMCLTGVRTDGWQRRWKRTCPTNIQGLVLIGPAHVTCPTPLNQSLWLEECSFWLVGAWVVGSTPRVEAVSTRLCEPK